MISISYPERTAFFCSSIFERSSSVIVRFTVLIAFVWSTDCTWIVTIWLESISRKSARTRSLRSEAVMERYDIAPYIFPIWNVRLPLNAKEVGAMKSFTDRPEDTSHFQSKWNLSSSPMWNISCIRCSLSLPFSTLADTPSLLKLLSRSVSTCSNFGFA